MTGFKQALTIARRDFVSIVMTPTFLLFLLAPLFMVAFGTVGGLSAKMMSDQSDQREDIVAFVPTDDADSVRAVDERLRAVWGSSNRAPPPLVVQPLTALGSSDAAAYMRAHPDTQGVLVGSLQSPVITVRTEGGFISRYLTAVAETARRQGANATLAQPMSRPSYALVTQARPGRSAQTSVGYFAVFMIFMLTLMLAGQSVGMLAEEKSNKVIEILAAAAPLEAVFFGKLLGMLGVAMLFVGFWASIVGGGAATLMQQTPEFASAVIAAQPAIGWPLFLLLGLLYFLSAFLLLGAVFLGIGAQASTVREIQMLSLPITIFQVAMFSLASAAANLPESSIATAAQMVPWSSPFAMAARAATDGAIWPHLLALAWQILWIGLTIALSVRAFRAGVLRSASFRWPWQRGKVEKASL